MSDDLTGSTSLTPVKTGDPLKDDFRNFLYVVWKHLNLPDPTPVQYDIAWYLQHGPRRKIIEAFRGVGKSWITAAYVCWRLYCDPQYKVMVVSASKALADSFSTFVKRLVGEIDILAHLRPKEGQRDSNIAFDVGPARASKDPSVKSVGITGQLTGSRADEIIPDDVESLNNSATQLQRDKLKELVKEFDAILKPGGRITYLGTPQTEMSIYNALPDRGYEIRVWPARIPESADRYLGRLSPFVLAMIEKGAKVRDPVDSRRFNHEDLLEREASYGRSGFALQFMLDTSLSDAERYPLKLLDLVVMPLDPRMAPIKVVWTSDVEKAITDLPSVGFTGDRYCRPMWTAGEMAEYTGSVMFIDPSGRGKDETGYAVVKILNGNLFLTAAGAAPGGYDDTAMKTLVKVASDQKVNLVLIESNFGDGMFAQLIKPHLARVHPVTVEEVRSVGQKELRVIEALEPIMNQHRLIVDASLVKADFEKTPEVKYQLFYQMTRITKERGALVHDDRIEAVAGAVQYWVEHMGRDTEKAADTHKAKMLDAELRKFATHILGYTPPGDTWFRLP